jgi:hypothetical protein
VSWAKRAPSRNVPREGGGGMKKTTSILAEQRCQRFLEPAFGDALEVCRARACSVLQPYLRHCLPEQRDQSVCSCWRYR